VESPEPYGLVRESYLKTEVEAWISRHVELYYITTCLDLEPANSLNHGGIQSFYRKGKKWQN
jgi:hypothetical protein